MFLDPLASDAPLIVYFDIKSPYAFVAKDPTYALADEFDIDVDWRPLTLDIPSYLGSARLDKVGKVAESTRTPEQWGGVRYAYMDARRYASAWGYGLRGTEKIWDTRLIHLAFSWVKRCDPGGRREVRAFLDAVYPRFWLRDLDVEDPGVVISQIELAGVSAAGFVEWAAEEGRQEHDEQQAAIFSAAIYGVPGYIYEREYYFGREHLPHLRCLIEGKAPGTVDVGFSLPDPNLLSDSVVAKHAVFLEMRQAAVAGKLAIVAGVNDDCLQTHLALKTLDVIQETSAGNLSITYGETRPSKNAVALVEPGDIDLVTNRGNAHRAFRSRYQFLDARRYAMWRDVSQFDPQANRFEKITISSEATIALAATGVNESFGFLFVDRAGVAHPFNGRAHLSVLVWALQAAHQVTTRLA